MSFGNRVFSLKITVLSPLHIDSGSRLLEDVDYYADGETTYVIDPDRALDLALQRWEANQLTPEEQRRQAEAELEAEEQRILRRKERNMRALTQFEQSPPKDRAKRQQQEDRLVREAKEIKTATVQLKARRAAFETEEFRPSTGLPDELVGNSGFADLLKTELLRLSDLRERVTVDERPLVRYALQGRPATGEIYEQIKDVADRPYLPGSSLKGAIRSALAWDLAPKLASNQLMQLTSGGAKMADNRIEEQIFLGQERRKINNTLRDVLRTLRIGDSSPVNVAPDLLWVAIFKSSSAKTHLAVEALPTGTNLRATLQIERYPFEGQEALKVLDFGAWRERLQPEALAAACRRRAANLIEGEQTYFSRFPEATELVRFYTELKQRLDGLGEQAFLLPVGWGAGWRSKTLDGHLRGEDEADEPFVEAVRRFNLKKHKSSGFKPGDSFPQTRKVTMAGNRPARPLGWVEVVIGNR